MLPILESQPAKCHQGEFLLPGRNLVTARPFQKKKLTPPEKKQKEVNLVGGFNPFEKY